MTMILASFCNLPAPGSVGIVRIEPQTQAYEPVLLGDYTVESCMGMSADATFVYVLAYRSGVYYLAALDRETLSLAFYQPLPEVHQGHSILAHDQSLYVASTGSDEVLRYTLHTNGVSDPQVIWKASDAATDTHHINSLTMWRGAIVISAFGPKAGVLWSTAEHGYIHDITNDVRVKDSIFHPHSLSVYGDQLYYCESHRRLFCSLEGTLFPLEGYTRGICWLSQDVVCLGTSIGRRVSKSTGLIANPADPGEPLGMSGVTMKRFSDNHSVASIDLSQFGPEIYDLLTLNES